MLPVLNVGPFALQSPGLVLLAGLWIALLIAERQAPRHGISGGLLYNLVFAALLAGLAGGRLGYFAGHLGAFLAAPLSLFSLNPQLFDTSFALLTAGLVSWLYASRRKIPLWPFLDALSPFLAVCMIAVHLANAASGSGFGAPTSLPWAVELWGARRHPSQLYEAAAAAAVLLGIWRSKPAAPPGLRFLTFLALTSLARLFLEAFRGDSLLLAGGVRAAQLAAWVVLAAALALFHRRRETRLEASRE